jgi:RNA recognition motif-containing protein
VLTICSRQVHPQTPVAADFRFAHSHPDDAFKRRKALSMSSKLYVGNLPYSVTDTSLKSNFSEFGTVNSAKVMMDRDTGNSKGFAFVEMASPEFAQAAITGLNGVSVDGRAIVVSLARPRESGGGAPGGAGGYSSAGYGGNKRSDVGYGTGGHGGGRY